MSINRFSNEVIDEIKYYVYKLIDPRTGNAFYVGKGKGNRVFAHVNDALKNYEDSDYTDEEEDDVSNKIQQIRDIRNSGLDVIHVIVRYGMDEKTAFEVESAVIDSTPGLTNIQSGHSHDRGIINTEVLQSSLSKQEYTEPNFKYMMIKINQSVLEERNNDLYETVRSAWRINLNKAKQYKYCLAVVDGIVRNVYNIDGWQEDHRAETGRYEFYGHEASKEIKDIFVNMRIPEKYRKKGMASPVLYCN